MGPPLYVPVGRFSAWRTGGHGGSNGKTNHLSVVTTDRSGREQLEVDTTTNASQTEAWSMATNLLLRSLTHDVSFPWTVTITERHISIPVDGVPIEMRMLESGSAWVAVGRIGDRLLKIEGRDIAPTAVEIEAVTDPELPDFRDSNADVE